MSKAKKPSLMIWLIVVILAVAGGYYAYTMKMVPPTAETETGQKVSSLDAAIEAIKGKAKKRNNYDPVPGVAPVTEINVEKALSERVLGNPEAPVKIAEHSSLTCGHCSNFHKSTFKSIRAAYLETGKAYWVFDDFPLNGPALHAAMTARCLPEKQYFNFIQMLYEHQQDWAYSAEYKDYLKEKAEPYGLSNDLFDECVSNQDIQKGILNRVRAIQGQWDIGSTPSFVINNQEVLVGALPYEEFEPKLATAFGDAKAVSMEGYDWTLTPSATEQNAGDGVAQDAIEETVEEAEEVVNEAEQTIEEAAEEAVEQAGEATEETAEQAEEQTEEAVSEVEQTTEAVAETVEEAVQDAAPEAENIPEAIEEGFEPVISEEGLQEEAASAPAPAPEGEESEESPESAQ